MAETETTDACCRARSGAAAGIGVSSDPVSFARRYPDNIRSRLTGWEHTVRIKRITDAVPAMTYPRLIEATGRCPPEDAGGPWGFTEFLAAIADPDHEEHDQTPLRSGSR